MRTHFKHRMTIHNVVALGLVVLLECGWWSLIAPRVQAMGWEMMPFTLLPVAVLAIGMDVIRLLFPLVVLVMDVVIDRLGRAGERT